MENAFLDAAAKHAVDINKQVKAAKVNISKRYVELLNDPDQRLQSIKDWFLGYMIEQTVVETGNEALAEAYWSNIEEYMQFSWDEINSDQFPPALRGDIWMTGRAVVSAMAYHQAFIESQLAQDIVESAIKAGPEQQALFNRLDKITQKKLSKENDKKNRIKQLESEIDNA